jgi:SPP1 gp7 family putative phage head morphogenesis protein
VSKPTDPMIIQSVVETELGQYNVATRNKVLKWVQDTRYRATKWSDVALTQVGIKTLGVLGPGSDPNVMKALQVNVINDIDSLATDAKKRVAQALIDGVNNGEGARDLTNRVMDATDLDRARAETIARTETMKAFNDTAQDQFKRYGIEKVKWLATDDERECDECGAHDGEEYPIDGAPEIPAHPNCRCILIPVVPEV